MDMRIVRIDGNEYRVPSSNDEHTVRQSLVQAGFPNASTAEIKKSKTTIEGTEYEVWEFIKKAGTKG